MTKLPTRSDFEALFWRATWFLLILGVASVGLETIDRWSDPFQHDLPELALTGLGISMWVGTVAVCALLLKAISRADLLQALAAMWRPLLLLCVAAYLLFFNDQGRELGLSLMGRNWSPLIFLFLALIYWATNNWHTARLRICDALERGALSVSHGNQVRRFVKDEPWLYWPPRLLGVCAHFFAAINLSLAAWGLPFSAWGGHDHVDVSGVRWLAWTAPLAILLVTALVWAEDVKRSRHGKAFASPGKKELARWVSRGSIVGEVVLLGTFVVLARFPNRAPVGFVPATIIISIAAVVFLASISWLWNRVPPIGPEASPERRAEDDRRQRKEITWFTRGLFLIACLVALTVWISPTFVGRYLGSMAVAYFAFGAILALVNAFEFAVVWTTERKWFGETARPRVVGAYAVALVIAIAVATPRLYPLHRVRPCDGDCVPVTSPDERPTVAAAARAWFVQAKAAYDKAHGEGPVPMLIVATAGGGIRAAYWTATVLEQLETDFKDQGGVRPYLFAISGVSGGSVGAMAFEAALTKRDESCTAGKSRRSACPLAMDFLKEDFLAPALASLVFMDVPSSFLPDLGQGDRGTAIEESFEHASDDLLARPFLSFFHFANDSVANERKESWRPILLLNATDEGSGKRIITSHVLIERNVFIDSFDALHILGRDVRASTAAHNSARFAYVSPAGALGYAGNMVSVIDGGYFDNYGALTALELVRAAKDQLKDKVKLVILMISSDPGLDPKMRVRINTTDGRKCLVSIAEREDGTDAQKPTGIANYPNYLGFSPGMPRAFGNQLLAPFVGINSVRGAHGNHAAAELAAEICAEFDKSPAAATLAASGNAKLNDSDSVKATSNKPYFAHLAMCNDGKPAPIQPPLGWVLSKPTEDAFEKLLGQCRNHDQLRELEIALGKEAPQLAAGP